jgi:N-carbamoyl-L-amino-acid hydrolase
MLGQQIYDLCYEIGKISSSTEYLYVPYPSEAHKTTQQALLKLFKKSGFDSIEVDELDNIRATYKGTGSRTLYTGSHYDTVKNGGHFDGRVGILVPMVAVKQFSQQGIRFKHNIELIAISEEETAFRGAKHLIKTLEPNSAIGFVEIHIEQGPQLYKQDIPLGIVTSINGSRRYEVNILGLGGHAGTTPMDYRNDPVTGACDFIHQFEQTVKTFNGAVGTVGYIESNGTMNVIADQVKFTLDIRAPNDSMLEQLDKAVVNTLIKVCNQRNLQFNTNLIISANSSQCDVALKQLWKDSVQELGINALELSSGAGHDSMILGQIIPQSMLFVRGLNNGISHHPDEYTTPEDIESATQAFIEFNKKIDIYISSGRNA